MRRKFNIRDTGKYGKGAFAARDIAKGEVIHLFEGKTVDVRELVERVNSGKENIDDPLQVGKRTYLDLDEVSRTFNHSCDPNAALRKRSELFAIMDIPKDKEITYDYSATIAPTEWKMQCKCGAKNCRKMLGDVLSIPKATRTKYRELGALQSYMKKLLDEVNRRGTYRMPMYETVALKSLTKTSNL